MKEKNRILSAEKVFRIMKRMAVEIYENNLSAQEVILVGIYDQGYKIAEYIQGELKSIDVAFKVSLVQLEIDKSNPSGEIQIDNELAFFNGKSIVIVDDVLNTSRTLAYSLRFLLQTNIEKVETAVLINRSHSKFPISSTYSGYELATTLTDHIEVRLEGEIGAFIY